jgi:hypothetical protein
LLNGFSVHKIKVDKAQESQAQKENKMNILDYTPLNPVEISRLTSIYYKKGLAKADSKQPFEAIKEYDKTIGLAPHQTESLTIGQQFLSLYNQPEEVL